MKMKIYNEEGLIDSDIQEILYELGNVGLGMASITIGKLIGLRMHIGVPEVVPVQQILQENQPTDRKAGILLDFQKDMGGSMLFMMDQDFVTEVIEKISRNEKMDSGKMDEQERMSVLQEFANMTSAAYLKAVGKYTGLRIFVKPVWTKFENRKELIAEVLKRAEKRFSKVVCVDAAYAIVYENGGKREDVGHVIMLPDEKTVEKLIQPLIGEM